MPRAMLLSGENYSILSTRATVIDDCKRYYRESIKKQADTNEKENYFKSYHLTFAVLYTLFIVIFKQFL